MKNPFVKLIKEIISTISTLIDNNKWELRNKLLIDEDIVSFVAKENIELFMDRDAQDRGEIPFGESLSYEDSDINKYLTQRGDEDYDLVNTKNKEIANKTIEAIKYIDKNIEGFKANTHNKSLRKDIKEIAVVFSMLSWKTLKRKMDINATIELLKREGKPVNEALLGYVKIFIPQLKGVSSKDLKAILLKEERLPHSKIEGNIIEYPKAVYSKGKKSSFTDGNYVVYKSDEGEELARIGSSYGYFEAFDENIFRGVMSFLTRVNDKYVCIFSDYQLLKRLGLSIKSGKNYKRLQEAKDKVSTLDISITKFRTDKDKNKALEGYPLFKARYLSKSGKKKAQKENNPLNFNYFILNDEFTGSIAKKYLFYYDLRDYQKIGKDTAKRIWEYIEKKRGNKLAYMENLRGFCRKIPIEIEKLNKARALIKKDLDILRDRGHIKDYNFDAFGNIVIHFSNKRKRYYRQESFVGEQAKLFLELIAAGIMEHTARGLIQGYNNTIIRFQLGVLPYRNVVDKAGALINSIKGNWTAPSNYAKAKDRERKKEKESLIKQPKSVNKDGQKQIKGLLDRLTDKMGERGTTGTIVLDHIAKERREKED
jgi:hypothetical protein